MSAPEFSRPYRLDQIGSTPLSVSIEARAEERALLAARFGLIGVEQLSATGQLVLRGAHPFAEGTLRAQVTQSCVATGAPVPVQIVQAFALRFVDEAVAPEGDEIEIVPDAEDEMPIHEGQLDLGEAAAQGMALALDPFPRAPDADEALRAAGVVKEGEEARGAFAGLRDLLS